MSGNNVSFRKERIECDDLVVTNSTKLGAVKKVTQGSGSGLATGVTIDASVGKITLSAVLAADGSANSAASFTVTNSFVTPESVIFLTSVAVTATADTTRNAVTCDIESVANGSFVVHISNNDGAATTAAPVIHFLVC